jgi:hypothetical protein
LPRHRLLLRTLRLLLLGSLLLLILRLLLGPLLLLLLLRPLLLGLLGSLLLLLLLRLLGPLLLLLLLRLLGPLLLLLGPLLLGLLGSLLPLLLPLLLLGLLGSLLPLLLPLLLLRLLGSLRLLLGPLLLRLLGSLLLLRLSPLLLLLPALSFVLLVLLRVRRDYRPEKQKQASGTGSSNELHSNRLLLTSLLDMHAGDQFTLTMFHRNLRPPSLRTTPRAQPEVPDQEEALDQIWSRDPTRSIAQFTSPSNACRSRPRENLQSTVLACVSNGVRQVIRARSSFL